MRSWFMVIAKVVKLSRAYNGSDEAVLWNRRPPGSAQVLGHVLEPHL